MSPQKLVTIKDLLQEGRKRLVFFALCVLGLSYIMSLTSSSVMVNLPSAMLLVIILRYFSLDFEMRCKAIMYKTSQPSQSKPSLVNNKVADDRSEWKRKVNSPLVEKALDHFTRHLISEWVTDLWYSRITPDKQGPEELVNIINGVLGEISFRMRNVNIIDLLTRDIINLICNQLKTFRAAQGKMKTLQSGALASENQDRELKVVLAAENKLHPALFSPEAEHKVLQHLITGLISYTFKSEDLQCTYFRYTVRELIACAVMRPVVNLASPRFINERIENVVKSRMKASKGFSETSKSEGISGLTSNVPQPPDNSVTGVELVSLKDKPASNTNKIRNKVSTVKDPLLSVDTHSSRSWSSVPSGSNSGEVQDVRKQPSIGEHSDVLDKMSQGKSRALFPENMEGNQAGAKNFRTNDGMAQKEVHNSVNGASICKDGPSKTEPNHLQKNEIVKADISVHEKSTTAGINGRKSSDYMNRKQIEPSKHPEEAAVSDTSSSSYTSDTDEAKNVTGLDSPEIKVWDSNKNKNSQLDHIHHPLESFDAHAKKSERDHTYRTRSGRKRFKVSSKKAPLWKEVQRTSFLSGDGQDILRSTGLSKSEESSDDYEVENFNRLQSNLTASSSSSSLLSVPESQSAANHVENLLFTNAFLRLSCEVTAANLVRSDSGTFAVYSVSVTDVNNKSWSVKRRFRHFEELHRRLKKYPEYKLHLPPKHFLSTGSEMSVIQERSRSLDMYLKRLMKLPTVSSAVEVWDFLSVDSQTYTFADSFSIIETLPVSRENSSCNGNKKIADYGESITTASTEGKDPRVQTKHKFIKHRSKLNSKQLGYSQVLETGKDSETRSEDPDNDLEVMIPKNANVSDQLSSAQRRKNDTLEDESLLSTDPANPAFPAEWVPPNLSAPLLDLVDTILQIEDGGWIRRKAFWVAKQLLHLGMGDALDEWMLEKLQRLHQGSVIASGIGRIEQILWPDGIFITKHPKRQRPPNVSSPTSSSNGQPPTQSVTRKEDQDFNEQQRQEADQRARLVYELMIEKAPSAVVSVIGRKEYEHCAKDLYFFIQSAVCLKQLAFELVELLLLTAFPELEQTMKELHEQKHLFGKLKEN